MKLFKTLCILLFSITCLFSCTNSIDENDLIGTWKTKDGKSIILFSNHTFIGDNVYSDNKIKNGEWDIKIYGGEKKLWISYKDVSEFLFLEKSIFSDSITIVKWIGDPDLYIRDEYVKVE